jgi:hypothetical protein
MRELAPTLGYDFRPVEQARDRLDAYGESALRRQAGGGGVRLKEFFTD